MNNIENNLLKLIADFNQTINGAFNIRINGQLESRNVTKNINISSKSDNSGIDIFVKPGTKGETAHIPVILCGTGIEDTVYNDFYIGENSDVVIIAGCGINNCGSEESRHNGIHTFHVGKNAHIKYIEKHLGEGDGNGEKIMNPTTIVNIEDGGYMEIETSQIKGIDSTNRITNVILSDNASIVIHEKIMTHGNQYAETNFTVDLNGKHSSANVISRSVAKNQSKQKFISNINGNNMCNGHSECDAIIMDNGIVTSIPAITANNIDASLIHEAAIGKIAGEQIIKLMTLGLTEQQAEEHIIDGFLK